MTREELEDTLTQARGFGGFGLDPFFASILDHDQQQRDELTSWCTTALAVGAVDPHALACHLGEQRKEIARLRAALDWSELRIDNTKLRWALNELGPTYTNAEAYVKAAVEHLIYMRFKAHAALKEGT